MINFKSKSGIHTVTVDGIAHVFDEVKDSRENKSALSMAWEYIEILSHMRGLIPPVKKVRIVI